MSEVTLRSTTLAGARLGMASVLVRRRAGPVTLLEKLSAGIILDLGARVLEPQHLPELVRISPWGKVEAVSEVLTRTDTLYRPSLG